MHNTVAKLRQSFQVLKKDWQAERRTRRRLQKKQRLESMPQRPTAQQSRRKEAPKRSESDGTAATALVSRGGDDNVRIFRRRLTAECTISIIYPSVAREQAEERAGRPGSPIVCKIGGNMKYTEPVTAVSLHGHDQNEPFGAIDEAVDEGRLQICPDFSSWPSEIRAVVKPHQSATEKHAGESSEAPEPLSGLTPAALGAAMAVTESSVPLEPTTHTAASSPPPSPHPQSPARPMDPADSPPPSPPPSGPLPSLPTLPPSPSPTTTRTPSQSSEPESDASHPECAQHTAPATTSTRTHVEPKVSRMHAWLNGLARQH